MIETKYPKVVIPTDEVNCQITVSCLDGMLSLKMEDLDVEPEGVIYIQCFLKETKASALRFALNFMCNHLEEMKRASAQPQTIDLAPNPG